MQKLNNSPTQKITFRNHNYFIKRDDLLHHDFSGNKARKFYYFFEKNLNDITTIVSFGGVQSNAMYSLSALAKIKNKNFIYYIKALPKYLKETPVGNYKFALENGMRIIEIDDFKNIQINKNILFIKQGGAESYAEYGVKLLAKEIENFADKNNLKELSIFLPSGTGTTALYLQKNIKFRVYTTPCVGDSKYLKEQFLELESNSKLHPIILNLDKKYHFGKLYLEFFEIYKELLNDTKIEFDLLYDSKGWMVIDKFKENLSKNILYIHCGGVIGNESMIERYKRKFISTLNPISPSSLC